MDKKLSLILKAIVQGSSDRAGCADDDAKILRRLKKLAEKDDDASLKKLEEVIRDLAGDGCDEF